MSIENSPLQENKSFTPEEEVKEILSFPKEERREKHREFKEKLSFQREGLIKIQVELIEMIRDNPDIPSSLLQKKMESLVSQYGIDEQRKSIIEKALKSYVKRRSSLNKLCREYPSDKDLFEFLFDKYPEGEIEIVKDPISLYIKCFDKKDYQTIFFDGEDDETSNREKLLDNSLGVSVDVDENIGKVNAENTEIVQKEPEPLVLSKSIRKHEEQHAINKLFSEAFPFLQIEGDTLLSRVRNERISLDESTKDEILAYYKEGEPAINIKNTFFSPSKESMLSFTSEKMKNAIKSLKKEGYFGEDVNRCAQKTFNEEYPALVDSCFEALQSAENSGYTHDEIIALLTYEPLSRWNKVIRRFIEGKNKKS